MANSVEFLYTASMSFGIVNTANANVDGTGSVVTVITGGASGTFVKTLIIKAITTTGVGMVRLYAGTGAGTNLISEIYIPPVVKSGRDAAYYTTIPLNYTLASGEVLKASTQVGDTFNIIAEAFDISYAATAAFLNSTLKYVWNASSKTVTTANANLNGSGAMVQILVADTVANGYSGCAITSIKIKSQMTTNPGMVRLYVADTSGGANPPMLFCEVVVPAMVQGATTQTFGHEAILSGSLCIPPSWSIYASTELTETFSVIVNAQDWKYV